MPGVYDGGKLDLAGFAMGAVERKGILPKGVRVGDTIIGVASSGFHANGFSLIRKIIENNKIDYDQELPGTNARLGEALIKPTTIYVGPALDCVDRDLVHAFAHITGGGLQENIVRVLPNHTKAIIDASQITVPEVISFIVDKGQIDRAEAFRTFNMGVGFCVICDPDHASAVHAIFSQYGMDCQNIGFIAQGEEQPTVDIKFA